MQPQNLLVICMISWYLAAQPAQVINFDLNAACRTQQRQLPPQNSWDYFGPLVEIEVCDAPVIFINNTSATWFYSQNTGHAASINRTAHVRSHWTFHSGVIPPFSYVEISNAAIMDKYFVVTTSQETLQKALQLLNGSKKQDTSSDWKLMQNVVVLQGSFKKGQLPQENIIVIDAVAPDSQSFTTGLAAVAKKPGLLKRLKQMPANESSVNLPVT